MAKGVRYKVQNAEYNVSASKEVIISAGSVKSPLILEQSGIGDPEVLSKANIPIKVASPCVGKNLQDHISKRQPSICEMETS